MSYQVSRWYDKHPRLGFAMQLMQLSPTEVQTEAVDVMGNVLDTMLADFVAESPVTSINPATDHRGNRWYDKIPAAPLVFERLKASPESLQKTAAEQLLAFFRQTGKA